MLALRAYSMAAVLKALQMKLKSSCVEFMVHSTLPVCRHMVHISGLPPATREYHNENLSMSNDCACVPLTMKAFKADKLPASPRSIPQAEVKSAAVIRSKHPHFVHNSMHQVHTPPARSWLPGVVSHRLALINSSHAPPTYFVQTHVAKGAHSHECTEKQRQTSLEKLMLFSHIFFEMKSNDGVDEK